MWAAKKCDRRYGSLFSFTPGFSQVPPPRKLIGNRLNGFRIGMPTEVTWLKPGVNEMESAFEASSHKRLKAGTQGQGLTNGL